MLAVESVDPTRTSGSVRVFDRSWEGDDIAILDGVAGFIESPRFYPYLTGRLNLQGLTPAGRRRRAGLLEEVLDVIEMSDRADLKVGGYSDGMRQRLGSAASVLREPRLVPKPAPAAADEVTFRIRLHDGVGPTGPVTLPVQRP